MAGSRRSSVAARANSGSDTVFARRRCRCVNNEPRPQLTDEVSGNAKARNGPTPSKRSFNALGVTPHIDTTLARPLALGNTNGGAGDQSGTMLFTP